MKTFTKLVFSLLMLLLFSCEKKYGVDISNTIDITVLNTQGQNLLAAPAVFTKSNIDIYHIVNGQAQLFDNSNLPTDGDFDYKGFKIIDEGASRIRIYLDYDVNRKETTSLTLVKFGTSKMDTLKGEFAFEGRSVSLRKVWLNGVLQTREFSLVK
jgi:hypothetical protein